CWGLKACASLEQDEVNAAAVNMSPTLTSTADEFRARFISFPSMSAAQLRLASRAPSRSKQTYRHLERRPIAHRRGHQGRPDAAWWRLGCERMCASSCRPRALSARHDATPFEVALAWLSDLSD